jgi:hypothetical protein
MGEVAELWAKLDGASDCKSILKKCLTKEIYEQLKDKKTPNPKLSKSPKVGVGCSTLSTLWYILMTASKRGWNTV